MRADPVETTELDHLTGDQERQHQLPGLHDGRTTPTLDEVLEVERWARSRTHELLDRR